MKRMLMRPSAALFPLALLAAAQLGNESVAVLFVAYLAIHLFSLCSIDAFRNAAAREPGVKRVDRRFSGAWPTVAFGIAAVAVIYMVWGKKEDLPVLIAAGMVVIEQLFEERMYALGKTMDGVLQAVIGNVLLLVGMVLDGGSLPAPVPGFYTLCATGIGALISVAASYIIEPMHAFSLIPRNIGFFPKAALQCLLYPAVIFALHFLAKVESGTEMNAMDFEALVSGMILWRLGRTVCRRTHDESRPLNLLLMAFAGAAVAVACCCGALSPCMDACFVAMICTAAVFCAPGWRIYVGAALVFAGWLVFMLADDMKWIALIFCVIAVILNLHRAFLRKV